MMGNFGVFIVEGFRRTSVQLQMEVGEDDVRPSDLVLGEVSRLASKNHSFSVRSRGRAMAPQQNRTEQLKKLGNCYITILPRHFSPIWGLHTPEDFTPSSVAVGTAWERVLPFQTLSGEHRPAKARPPRVPRSPSSIHPVPILHHLLLDFP
jgi:hypothetical protein